jgi:antitoxin component YwqK of YwqJK toxin-antitoxin module
MNACKYLDDKRHGFMRTYNTNGSVSMQGMFKNGVKDSIWNYYDDSGELEIQLMYKRGIVKNQDELDKHVEQKNQFRK